MSISRPPAQNCWPPIAWRPPAIATGSCSSRARPHGRLNGIHRVNRHDLEDVAAVELGVDVVDEHYADAAVFVFLSAFWAMNFSVASYASSSTICTGGDFIR